MVEKTRMSPFLFSPFVFFVGGVKDNRGGSAGERDDHETRRNQKLTDLGNDQQALAVNGVSEKAAEEK